MTQKEKLKMNNANKCPKCKQYILGTYCYTCKQDINDMISTDSMPDFMKEFFSKKEKND